MLKHLFSNLRAWWTRLLLAVGLVACLGWLALWCFCHPLPHGSGSANNSVVREAPDPKEERKELSAPTRLTPQMKGAEARQYLEHTDEGQSLAAAMNESQVLDQ